MRARSALFTLFGDVVRPAGGEAWLTTLTGCMGALGFTPEATRTALHRMAVEGWVEPRKVGRYAAYRLTARGFDRLEEAAARIYRLRAVDWDGRWRLLIAPASGNGGEEFARALRWMGFGRLTGDTWVSPHPHGERLTMVLADHGRPNALRFATQADDTEPERDRSIVRQAWDVRELSEAQAAFIDRWAGVTAPEDPQPAFTTRIQLVHDWRSFLFLDPGLPVSLLPEDWLGDRAAQCFRRLYEAVEAPAWRFHDALASSAPYGRSAPSADARNPDASPFARGLAALATPRPTTPGPRSAARAAQAAQRETA